jgi:hypothetical protein
MPWALAETQAFSGRPGGPVPLFLRERRDRSPVPAFPQKGLLFTVKRDEIGKIQKSDGFEKGDT